MLLIYNIMDEVEYNAQGNRVKMVKRPDRSAETQLVEPDTANDKHTSERLILSLGVAASRRWIPTFTAQISFLKSWRWWSIPALLGLILVLWFVDPFIGDWDGLDYTMLSLAGYPSSMALGRNLFIFENHALYQLAHRLFNVPAGKRIPDL